MEKFDSAQDARVSLYEDTRHWANLAMWSIQLQIQRLRSGKAELRGFVLQPLADFHFLLIAIGRLRKAAEIASTVSNIDDELKAFDGAVPWLRKCRNVMEHIGDYRSGEGRDKSVSVEQLQVFSWGDDRLEWIGERIEFVPTVAASTKLFHAIQKIWPDGLSKDG